LKFAEFTLALDYQGIKRENQKSPMNFKVFNVCFERAEQKIGCDEYGEYAEIQRLLQTLWSSHELELSWSTSTNSWEDYKVCNAVCTIATCLEPECIPTAQVRWHMTIRRCKACISDLVQVLCSIAKFDSLLGIRLNSQNLSKTTLKTKQFSHVQETNSGPIQSYIT
jgi:hypothetical protein